MNAKQQNPQTLKEAIEYFSDPQRAFELAVRLRWPNGVACPTCEGDDLVFISTRRIWRCKVCRKQFSVKVGTIMEDSPLGLDKWLAAIWMIANDKNGVSSYEIHRALGITQKSAWFMLHRIRVAMQTGSFKKMSGVIEADETFIGGEAKNMHKRKREAKFGGAGASAGKIIVMGLLNRSKKRKTKEDKKKKRGDHSTVRATVIPSLRGKTMKAEIRKYVMGGSSIYTDEAAPYEKLYGYIHEAVNHSREYVRGNVHTNGLENFWSLFARCLRGTYISVEPDHLQAYVTEEVFRFNNRETNDPGRFLEVAGHTKGHRLTYKQLIGNVE